MNKTSAANSFSTFAEPIKEKASILIIDNSRDFTHAAKFALEKTGRYIVGEENDSSKAHQTARSFKPDLILLDIAMPETGGGEVAAWIQSDPALHRIPIVFLTALVTMAEGRSGLRIQGHSFLAKPISIRDLIRGIEENLPALVPNPSRDWMEMLDFARTIDIADEIELAADCVALPFAPPLRVRELDLLRNLLRLESKAARRHSAAAR